MIENVDPSGIEKRSFEIIESELSGIDVVINGNVKVDADTDPCIYSIIKRCIHTTADFDFSNTMRYSKNAVEKLQSLIREGASIVTDTNMALAGINKKILSAYGCRYFCFMSDEGVIAEAAKRHVTRAQVSMERAMQLSGPVIFVVGNAPTALITLKEHYDRGQYVPAFVVGVPVGFVNVIPAKQMIIDTDIPYIVNSGRKGGSTVAAAIVNACLYEMTKEAESEAKLDDHAGFGFTTGSCAAAAAKAATAMLFEQRTIERVSVITPVGVRYDAPLSNIMLTNDSCSCAVKKPESNDPDVTAGILIFARATLEPEGMGEVIIEGGEGIGKLTKPGLDRPVGDFAINSVPRRMIEQEVSSVAEEYEYTGSVKIVISAPGGEEIAKKTFNPRFGIEGGISIIGTSGLVEPMSTKAVVDTIKAELSQKKALCEDIAVITPGNYGMDFMREHFGYDLDKAAKCSNYLGDTIDIAKELGFTKMLIVGHAGKLVKLAGGIMNTHSSMADCRMEIMAAAAARCGAEKDLLIRILDSASTEEAYGYMKEAQIAEAGFRCIMERVAYHLAKRAGEMQTECIIYSTRYGIVGTTEGAEAMMEAVL